MGSGYRTDTNTEQLLRDSPKPPRLEVENVQGVGLVAQRLRAAREHFHPGLVLWSIKSCCKFTCPLLEVFGNSR